MVEIGYAESTMSNFRECWRALKNHANNNGIEYLTKDVGFQLLKDHYGIDPQQFTRAGIAYILKKYVDIARTETPDIIPDKSSPHCMRHSKAMHLLQAGVAIIYIRDFLGHCSINTTEVYARSDEKMKREALSITKGIPFLSRVLRNLQNEGVISINPLSVISTHKHSVCNEYF